MLILLFLLLMSTIEEHFLPLLTLKHTSVLVSSSGHSHFLNVARTQKKGSEKYREWPGDEATSV